MERFQRYNKMEIKKLDVWNDGVFSIDIFSEAGRTGREKENEEIYESLTKNGFLETIKNIKNDTMPRTLERITRKAIFNCYIKQASRNL